MHAAQSALPSAGLNACQQTLGWPAAQQQWCTLHEPPKIHTHTPCVHTHTHLIPQA